MRRITKYTSSTKKEVASLMTSGMTNREISDLLDIPMSTLQDWRTSLGLSPPRTFYDSLSSELVEEALFQIDEGKNDTEISGILGLSTHIIRKIRDEHNRPRSDQWAKYVPSTEKINDIIDLIREGATVQQIYEETGIGKKRIIELRAEEIRQGNDLPEFRKGVARRQKYTDEELIELAFLNPGYGLKRFIQFLGVTQDFVLDLFLEFKEFTDGEEDPLATLQDPSFVSWVTKAEYKRVVGGPIPKGYGAKGSAGGSKANFDAPQALVPVPPLDFNWGPYEEKIY